MAHSDPEQKLALARAVMDAFAARTGLDNDRPPRRYLWTDAFAVCNFVALCRRSGGARYRALALQLVDQVHWILGRYRPDDRRSGWLSGLSEEEGWRHPTAGGLRIGKPLPERGVSDPYDEMLEWERDGQYFHYLTKWMHALVRFAPLQEDCRALSWAAELVRVARERFCHRAGASGRRILYWKMSTDLTRPLVPAAGEHDPLDGLVTCREIQAAAMAHGVRPAEDLAEEARGYAKLAGRHPLVTDDPLGLGGLLFDAVRLAELALAGLEADGGRLASVLAAALQGLRARERRPPESSPAARLAFRELGLAIGLAGAGRLDALLRGNPQLFGGAADLPRLAQAIAAHGEQGEAILAFWLVEDHRRATSWTEHRDINEVMLATALVPEGFLGLD